MRRKRRDGTTNTATQAEQILLYKWVCLFFCNFSMICVTNNPCTGITTLQVEHLCLDKPFNRVKKDSSDFTPYEGKNIAR